VVRKANSIDAVMGGPNFISENASNTDRSSGQGEGTNRQFDVEVRLSGV